MFLSEPITLIKNARRIWGHAECQPPRPCPGLTPGAHKHAHTYSADLVMLHLVETHGWYCLNYLALCSISESHTHTSTGEAKSGSPFPTRNTQPKKKNIMLFVTYWHKRHNLQTIWQILGDKTSLSSAATLFLSEHAHRKQTKNISSSWVWYLDACLKCGAVYCQGDG